MATVSTADFFSRAYSDTGDTPLSCDNPPLLELRLELEWSFFEGVFPNFGPGFGAVVGAVDGTSLARADGSIVEVEESLQI